MSIFEDSVTYMSVLNVANALTDVTDSVEDLPTGSGGFFFADSDLYEDDTAAVAATRYFYAWRDTAGVLHKTPIFLGSQIANAAYLADIARVEQLTYLGYNGVSGEMDDSNSTYFGLKVVLNHTFGTLNNSPLIKTIPYKTIAASSQNDLARGLALAGQKAFDRAPNRDVIFDAVCNEGVTAANCFDNNVTVVKGATTFTVGTNLQYNTAAGTAVAGDFVRLGGAAATRFTTPAATALGSAVYKIISIDTLTVTVDRKITVASGTYTAAGDMAEVITAAEGAAADWGLRMDGNTPAQTTFNPLTDTPFVVDFAVLSDDFDTAEVTYTTGAFLGAGLYDIISSQEAYTQFQDKMRHVSAYPSHTPRIDAVNTGTYDVFSFDVTDAVYTPPTTGINPKSKWRLVIAIEDGLTDEVTTFGTFLGL